MTMTVLFESLDKARATEYATFESVIKLSIELIKQENLSYMDLKTWTPVTANPSNHIVSCRCMYCRRAVS